MSTITVLGGTGYAGSAIVAEAAHRGHTVTAISRSQPDQPVDGVTYIQGSVLDPDIQARAFAGADAVISTTSPRGDMEGKLPGLHRELLSKAADAGARLGVVGGFSPLRPAPGAPRFSEGEIDETYRTEALEGAAVLEVMLAAPEGADWVYFSPAAQFGSYAPHAKRGTYRLGGDVALFDADGVSAIGAEDFAIAILDVIESGEHSREHVSAAY
ncbi:MAG: NAD-dependent epimerase [Actinobacteria bacterium HGW-Actinobacteria-4]|nr:MAG: NAD-dependent epimerase [Actinobacteria bacterium HGW-Actinobacteria-4]